MNQRRLKCAFQVFPEGNQERQFLGYGFLKLQFQNLQMAAAVRVAFRSVLREPEVASFAGVLGIGFDTAPLVFGGVPIGRDFVILLLLCLAIRNPGGNVDSVEQVAVDKGNELQDKRQSDDPGGGEWR